MKRSVRRSQTARSLRALLCSTPIAFASALSLVPGCGDPGSNGSKGAGGHEGGATSGTGAAGAPNGGSAGGSGAGATPAVDGGVTDAFDTTGPTDAAASQTALDGRLDGSAAAANDSADDAALKGDIPDGSSFAKTGPGAWMVGTPIQSMARQEVGVAAIGDRVYVVGGYSRLVDAYDTKTGQWIPLSPLPAALDHSNVAAVAGKLYVVGATEAEKTIPGDVNAFLVYDVSLNQWSKIRPMPAGTERGASGVAVIGTTIYVVGGWKTYGTATSYFSSYDTLTDAWQVLPDIVPKRDHLVAGAVSGMVYSVGGRNGTIGTPMGRVDVFDPVARTWSARAPMITPRGGTAGAVLFNEIYVFGGEGNTAPGSNGVFSTAEVYDPLADSWRSLAPMPIAKHGIGAASVSGKIYLPGGAVRQGGNAQVASMEIFIP